MDDAPPRPVTPKFRLRVGAVFGHVALISLIVAELLLWMEWQNAGRRPGGRPHLILAILYFTPRLAYRSMTIGVVAAVVIDLGFRLIVRPMMQRWYAPSPRDPFWTHPHPFFAKVGEQVLTEVGARRVEAGRRRPAGRLVISDCGLYFYPYAWNQEPWTLPLGHLRRVATRTPRRRVLGLVEGYPDNLVVTDDAGEETAFVVADPAALLKVLGGRDVPAPHTVA